MNPFEELLAKEANKTKEAQEAIVNETKLLLSDNAAEERTTLKSIGLDRDIRYAEHKKENLLIRSLNSTKFDKQIIHADEIAKLCANYRLYIRPASTYRGTIPPTLAAELSRYCKEKNIVLASSSSYSKFFMIAPPKMFDGYTSPLGMLGRSVDYTITQAEERAAERERLKRADPILVYQLPDNPNYFAVIKSWGSDLTVVRRAYALLTTKTTMKLFVWAVMGLLLYGLYSLAAMQTMYFYGLDEAARAVKQDSGWIVIAVIIDCGLFIVGVILLFGEPFRNLREFFTDTVPNKFTRVLDRY